MNPLEIALLTGLAASVLLLVILTIALVRLLSRLSRSGAGGIAGDEGASAALGAVGSQLQRVDDQLAQLHRVFMTPRLRGPAGEVLLQNLIESWLPRESYEFQYGFSNGTRADAVLRLGDHLVPVDAKFPLEQLSASGLIDLSNDLAGPTSGDQTADAARDDADVDAYVSVDTDPSSRAAAQATRILQEHAGSIATKYIRPAEGTLDFALMYIPSEAVYYGLLRVLPDFHTHALRLHVLPVSPTTLFVYVQTIAYGLRGLKLNAETHAIMQRMSELSRQVSVIRDTLDTARTQARNLSRNLEESDLGLSQLKAEMESPLARRGGRTGK